jgi:hypothetical protein
MCMGYSCVALFEKMGLGMPCLGNSLPYGWGSALAWTHNSKHNIKVRLHIRPSKQNQNILPVLERFGTATLISFM